MTKMRLIPVLLAMGLLSACGSKEESGDERRAASGEVLEGTISDEMLPIDQVRSEAPLAPPEPGEGATPGATRAPGATSTPTDDAEEAPADPIETLAPTEPAAAE